MKETNIEWADSTVTPVSGCDGCELAVPAKPGKATCYAKWLHEGRLAKALPLLYAPSFHDVRLIPGRTAKSARWPDLRGKDRPDKPWLNGLPRCIFLSDMADALSKSVPFEFLKQEVIDVAMSAPGRRHNWLWLTKQPQRMAEFSRWLEARGIPWPANVWPGTSVTRQATVPRTHHLLKVGGPGTTRFVSAEPLLEGIDLRRCLGYADPGHCESDGWVSGVNLVIVGGESGPGARPMHPAWARSIIRQCAVSGVSCFVKQMGTNPVGLKLADKKGGDPAEWPEDLRVREFPGTRNYSSAR